MASVVVDTDVASYLHKKDSRARLFQRHLVGRDWVMSFMSVAELEEWAEKRRWARHAGKSWRGTWRASWFTLLDVFESVDDHTLLRRVSARCDNKSCGRIKFETVAQVSSDTAVRS